MIGTSGSLLLAIDTAGPVPGLALARGAEVLAAVYEPSAARKAEDLREALTGLLARCGAAAADLHALAVVTGPGSYTGLRVGLALVRGLAFADRLPVVGLGALELTAMAGPAGAAGAQVLALLDAGRGKLYAAGFRRGAGRGLTLEIEPAVLEVEEAAGMVRALGTGAVVHADEAALLQLQTASPGLAADARVTGPRRAELLAIVAAERLAEGAGEAAERVLASYLGGSGARPNRNRVAVTSATD